MIIVWILLGFFGLLALALTFPLKIFCHYVPEGELTFQVKYLFLTLFDSEKESEKKPAAAPEEKKAPTKKSGSGAAKALLSFLGLEDVSSSENIKLALREKGLLETVSGVCTALGDLLSRLFCLIKKGRFRRFDLKITIGDGDAADAASSYGALCAAVYPLVSVLVPPRHRQLDLHCDFERTETTVYFDGQVNYRPWSFVGFLLGLLWRYIKNTLRKKDGN